MTASTSKTHSTNDHPTMLTMEPAPSASSSDFGSCSSDAPGFVVEICNLDPETTAEDLVVRCGLFDSAVYLLIYEVTGQAICEDFGSVVGASVEQDVVRGAITATVTFSNESEGRTAAMALDSQIADGRSLEATLRGANDILKVILPSTAIDQRAGHPNDRPPLPFPPTGVSFDPSAASFSPSSRLASTAAAIEPDLGHTPSTRANTPSSTGAVADWKAPSVAKWSSPASTFAPSEASRASSEKPSSLAHNDTDTADKPELRSLSKDRDLSADAWLAGETVKTPTKADSHAKSGEKPTKELQSPKWNIAAASLSPLSLAVSSSEVAGREAENKADDSGVWLLRSPKSKAIPIQPAPKPALASSSASPSSPIQEHIGASVGKGGFVSAQSLQESRFPPPSPTLSEASTTTIPRSLPLKSSAKAFVPSSYPDSSAAAFWAGQAMAMAKYGIPSINMLQQPGYVPTLMVQNDLNPQANTYQPGSYGIALATRTDLNIGAKAFFPSAPRPFPCELESYSELFVKAGVESMEDLKEMLDTPELVNEFVDDLRKEYPIDLTTFKAAFKLKVQLKKTLKL